MTETLALVWSCRGIAHRAAVAVWPGQFFVARFIGVERLQGSEKCRAPGENRLSGGNEKLAEEIERLLRAAGDQSVLNGQRTPRRLMSSAIQALRSGSPSGTEY